MEVFRAGWRCSGLSGGVLGWMGVFWAGKSCFGLAPICDFDITLRYAMRRKMSKNVEFCRSHYWGYLLLRIAFLRLINILLIYLSTIH